MRILKCIIASVVLAACVSLASFAQGNVTVTLNGKTVDCESYGQEAAIVEGRTLVPLRAIFEALGASVEWNQETKTVFSALGETQISLTIGDNKLIRNGEEIALDVPAQIMNGRTMVPARAVAESFGVLVEWDGEARSVLLMTGEYVYNAYLDGILEDIEPKTDLDKEILAYVGGIPVSAATVRSYVMMACDGGQNVADENVQKELETLYKQDAALVKFAYNERIILEDTDVNQVKASVVGLQIQLGENYEKAFAESPYTKYFYYLNSALYPVVYSKISATYSDGKNEQINAKVVEYLEENEYVRAKHILIQFKGDTEEERTEALNRALEVLVKVNAMKDISEFDALIEEYNEDPGMSMNPGGYYFTRGEMVKPFEDATYALEEGKTGSIIETDYGYHIILRLPVNDENLVNSSIYPSAVSEVLWETIIGISDGLEVEYADNYDERVKDFEKEYEELMASLQ